MVVSAVHGFNSFNTVEPARLIDQVIFACVYGVDTSLRLKQAGMEFAVWVFRNAAREQLAPAAAIVLRGLLQLLDDGPPVNDTASLLLRGFTYQVR